MNKLNLYNSDKVLVRNKTVQTINYILSLESPILDTREEKLKFNRIIQKALSKSTANEMLDTIGYNIYGKDRIYDYAKIKNIRVN